MAKAKNIPHKTHNYFEIALKIVGFLVLALIFIVILLVLVTYFSYQSEKKNQAIKYTTAVKQCQKDPVIIMQNYSGLFGGQTSFDLYTPVNPNYNDYKAFVDSPFDIFGTTDIQGYYCNLDEAVSSYYADGSHSFIQLEDNSGNYTGAAQQSAKENFLNEQGKNGVKFYAPISEIPGFRVESREILLPDGSYSIEYKRANPTSDVQKGDSLNLRCFTINNPQSPSTTLDDKLKDNAYNGPIYFQDYGVKTLKSILPTSECDFEYWGSLDNGTALSYVASIREVDKSTIASYNLRVLYALPGCSAIEGKNVRFSDCLVDDKRDISYLKLNVSNIRKLDMTQ